MMLLRGFLAAGLTCGTAGGACAVDAFPGAEGYGRAATGGRGGSVFHVTTLADSGPGSLRACVEAAGPRTCVFRVGGTIALDKELMVRNGKLTIAGQSAPGGGIALKLGASSRPTLYVKAPDVVVRHVRFRPGPCPATCDTSDGVTIEASRVILDHVSASWGTDENINTTKTATDVTIQWSLIYEGLDRSTHRAPHSKGLLAEGDRLTLHRNLLAHNWDRNPNLGAGGRVDVVNNVVYDWGEKAPEAFSMFRKGTTVPWARRVNFVGNYVSMGPSSLRGAAAWGVNFNRQYSQGADFQVHLRGNLDPRRTADTQDERLVLDPADWGYVQPAPVGAGGLSVARPTSAPQAIRDTLQFAGAMPRDAADARVVGSVRGCTGSVIDDPSEVGGWPTLAGGTPYPDADKDGMDDRWEAARGVTAGAADADADGYTNLEEFLAERAGDQDSAGRPMSRAGTGAGAVPVHNCGIAAR